MDLKDGGKKKTPDGLSKKERRALKVAAEGKNANPVNHQLKGKGTIVEVPKGVPEIKNPVQNQNLLSECSTQNGVPSQLEGSLNKKARRALKVTASGKSVLNEQEQNNSVKSVKVNVENKTLPKVEMIKQESEESKDGGASKAELRAQRRAVQEAQRLAKLNAKNEKVVSKVEEKPKVVSTQPATATKTINKVKTKPKPTIQLFSHLNFKKMDIGGIQFNFDDIHPEFYYLGSCYASKSIIGSNSRCLKMLEAIKILIEDFNTPSDEEFRRSFKSKLTNCINYIQQCRPLAFAMSNAVQHIQLFLNEKLDVSLSECDQKAQVLNFVTAYENEEFEKASESISSNVTSKMLSPEVILVYGHSSVVVKTLMDAHHQNKSFKVIVIDCGPLYEGKKTLSKLESIGICCTYAHISNLTSVIMPVTKVLLGANALFGNGCIMSRTGTAQVALTARNHNKSIMFCMESHKYADAIQADAFVHNETDESSYRHEFKTTNFLNIMYDVTPPSLYDKFVTEIGSFYGLNAPHLMRCKALRAKKTA